MNMLRILLLTLGLGLSSAGGVRGDDPVAKPDPVEAILARIEQYVAAYNSQDAKALAECWSEEAVYLDPESGEEVKGREAIGAKFAGLFADAPGSLTVDVDAIRLVTPDVAIEDGTAVLDAGGEEPEVSSYVAVHVLKEGQWYLDSVRETQLPGSPPPEAGELAELAWLVGEWLDEDEQASIHTRCRWAKNHRFLLSDFAVLAEDRLELAGTQIIGWDPGAKAIRSWIFDSEGGIGQGRWRRVGNQWIVDVKSTLSDGTKASAVNVYTLRDDDSFTWKSTDRVVAGQQEPDVDEVLVVRK